MSEHATRQSRSRFWVIIPAAGIGRRMRADIPKQYLPLAGRTVIEHTLHRLSLHPAIAEIIVVLGEDDQWWRKLRLDFVARPVTTVTGGEERCHSVLNGLQALARRADEHDWVLVHDAARPCVRPGDIETLITHCRDEEAGGLLALPVHDTVKLADDSGHVVETLDRNALWRALTPQMFRYGILRQALQHAIDTQELVTDEAMAIELVGKPARLVEGHADNIKITTPEDLALAAFLLEQQREQGVGIFDDGMDDGG